MSQAYNAIRLDNLEQDPDLASPSVDIEHLSVTSPAIHVMTDFTQVKPITINESVAIDDALEVMKTQHVRLLVVVNASGKASGIISAADIMGDKAMVYMQNHGVGRDMLEVKDLMLPRNKIHVLRMEQLERAKVGDVMLTLKSSGDQHLLIMEGSEQQCRIRGVVSASDISRKLKISFEVIYSANSLVELEQIIHHGQVA